MRKGTPKARHWRTSKRGRKFPAGRGKRRRAQLERKFMEPESARLLREHGEKQKEELKELLGPTMAEEVYTTPKERKARQYRILTPEIGPAQAFERVYGFSMYEVPYPVVQEMIGTPKKTYGSQPIMTFEMRKRKLAKEQARTPKGTIRFYEIPEEIEKVRKEEKEVIGKAQRW